MCVRECVYVRETCGVTKMGKVPGSHPMVQYLGY